MDGYSKSNVANWRVFRYGHEVEFRNFVGGEKLKVSHEQRLALSEAIQVIGMEVCYIACGLFGVVSADGVWIIGFGISVRNCGYAIPV